jgi:sugar lactone lactonase YvrE
MRPYLFVLGLGILCLRGMAVGDQPRLQRPIMLDSNGPDLFVVDSSGTLHEFHIGPTTLKEFRSFPLPSDFAPTDMSYSIVDDRESLLIAGSQAGHGAVVRYALDGKVMQTWAFRNICSGIDYATAGHAAYVATSDSNEIYRLDLRGAEIKYIGRIPNATKLGPLAFDETNKRIYVADVATGTIYQYSMATNVSEVLVSDLSAPTALSFDPVPGRLYTADPGRRAIFTIDTRASKASSIEFASAPLKSPYGMAQVANGRLAVADYGGDGILVFSGTGEFLFRFPSAN